MPEQHRHLVLAETAVGSGHHHARRAAIRVGGPLHSRRYPAGNLARAPPPPPPLPRETQQAPHPRPPPPPAAFAGNLPDTATKPFWGTHETILKQTRDNSV